MAKWVGLMAVAPALWFLLFVLYDQLLGDLRTTPWGMLVLALLSHVAPEGGISGTIWLDTFGVEILLFCAFFSRWIAPHFAIAFLGSKQQTEAIFDTAPLPIRRARVTSQATGIRRDELGPFPDPAS